MHTVSEVTLPSLAQVGLDGLADDVVSGFTALESLDLSNNNIKALDWFV